MLAPTSTVLVFGVTGNVGYGAVRALPAAGARVIAVTRSHERAQALPGLLGAPERTQAVVGDLGTPEGAEAVARGLQAPLTNTPPPAATATNTAVPTLTPTATTPATATPQPNYRLTEQTRLCRDDEAITRIEVVVLDAFLKMMRRALKWK